MLKKLAKTQIVLIFRDKYVVYLFVGLFLGGYPAVCGAKVYPQIGGMVHRNNNNNNNNND